MAALKCLLQFLKVAAPAGELKAELRFLSIEKHDRSRLGLTHKVIIDHHEERFLSLNEERVFSWQ